MGSWGGVFDKAPQGAHMYLIHICSKENIELLSIFSERKGKTAKGRALKAA